MKVQSLRVRLFRLSAVLLPLIILVVTGLRGLDFGNHWDEKGWQIAPVKTMLALRAPLPGHYGYPSFNYWVSSAALAPDIVEVWDENTGRGERLLEVLGSQSYLLRDRSIFLIINSLSVLWVYLLVLTWRESWQEALLAACFLAFSWEVAYHIRWIATDGMLMQFGALTILCAMLACLKPHGIRWLYVAAVTAGMGMGTKYPGGLLLIPVLVAGYLIYREQSFRQLAVRLGILSAIFVSTFIISTPAILLRPAEVLKGVLYEIQHYSSGHAGHTVSPGLEHSWRMLIYLSTVVFSHYPVIALTVFGLSLIGTIAFIRQERILVLLFLSFPVLYFLYFCIQKAMVVRNLLVLVPFLAILAARGAGTIWEWTRPAPSWNRNTARLIRGALIASITLAMCVNVGWLFYAAETIASRHSDRFAIEAINHIEKERQSRFYLSPLVRIHFQQVAQNLPANVTANAAEAERVLLYASEGLPWWQSWPANRPDLTERWFGPYEVNFNIYPNWWGDDRIIEITKQRANELGILICCGASLVPESSLAAPYRVHAQIAHSGPMMSSWAIPDIEPCTLVRRAEAEAIMGTLREGPRPGGTAADGTACAYVGERPIVASIGVISTKSFEDRSSEPGNVSIPDLAQEMFVAQTNAFRDVTLLARQGEIALMIHLAAWEIPDVEKLSIARGIATAAFVRLAEIAP